MTLIFSIPISQAPNYAFVHGKLTLLSAVLNKSDVFSGDENKDSLLYGTINVDIG